MNLLTQFPRAFALSLVALAAAGCEAPSGPLAVSAVASRGEMERYAPQFWLNHNVPPIHKSSERKVAIAEFSVEFVTERLETSDGKTGRPYVRATADFGEGLKMELPSMLYHALQEEGELNLVPIGTVAKAAAYQRFQGPMMGDRSASYRLGMVGSDAGRPKQAGLYTVDGLRAIDPQQADVEKVSADLLKEVGADVVLRFRLRVGVYGGRATLEAGSVVDLVGPGRVGDLESIRSLIGDGSVLDEAAAPAGDEVTYVVNSAKFRDAIRRMAVPYITMAAMVTRR
jgi:hypothetical protein